MTLKKHDQTKPNRYTKWKP